MHVLHAIVDNYVFITTFVLAVLGVFAVMRMRKLQTNEGEKVDDDLLVEDSQPVPQSKKTIKLKPKKTKPAKALCFPQTNGGEKVGDELFVEDSQPVPQSKKTVEGKYTQFELPGKFMKVSYNDSLSDKSM